MTKTEMTDGIAKSAAITKKAAAAALDALIEIITKDLKKGNNVVITGFGTFRVSKRNARSGVKRWFYRLARKAVPEKADVPAITFRMETLHRQSGTTRPQRNFAIDIRKIAETQHLPEYSLRIDRDGKHELVSLFRDPAKPGRFPRGFRLSVARAGVQSPTAAPG